MLSGILGHLHDYVKPEMEYNGITVGMVVDTNDPQQMGRVRALCPQLGDDPEEPDVGDIPWASYASPFGGSVSDENFSRGGTEDATTFGHVGYGMWNIPKEGALVLIMCLDGDPQYRVWVGCLYGQNLNHTLPHGRYSFDMIAWGDGDPDGPFSTGGEPIQPLHDNLSKAFNEEKSSPEWRTRGADYSVAGVNNDLLPELDAVIFAPDEITEHPGSYTDATGSYTVAQGYAVSRSEPDAQPADEEIRKNSDPQTYSWTSPGFHSIAMDDRIENCRVRLRTTTGHQILLDDTNERIYISTAEGNNWVELDKSGNIDIHSERRISIHAAKDMNFSTDETFRVHAKKGIHMYSGGETRLHSKQDFHVDTSSSLRLYSTSDMFLETGNTMNLKASQEFKVESSSTLHIKSGSDMLLTGGPNIHINGPSASSASPASQKQSFWTNRVPAHEPWPRVMMDAGSTDNDSGNSHVLELSSDSADVGKKELGDTITRGPYWRR